MKTVSRTLRLDSDLVDDIGQLCWAESENFNSMVEILLKRQMYGSDVRAINTIIMDLKEGACADLDRSSEHAIARSQGKMEAYSHAYSLLVRILGPENKPTVDATKEKRDE